MFQKVRALFRNLTPRPKRGVLVCPKCKSKRIRQADSISGFITPPRYFCRNCGYSGYFIVEIDEEDEKEEDDF